MHFPVVISKQVTRGDALIASRNVAENFEDRWQLSVDSLEVSIVDSVFGTRPERQVSGG